MLILDQIRKAQNIILSTHKSSDGDGLGSEISMYLALKKMNKTVHFYHADKIPMRYHFLAEKISPEAFITDIKNLPKASPLGEGTDLVLIFDTHDPKLCSPLYDYMANRSVPIFFIDHHVPTEYVTKSSSTYIDENASCTGEIVFELIKKLEISIDVQMASALYASLIFDTQNFKHIRDLRKPFQMASELLLTGIDHNKIQQQIFAHWNIEKMSYLSYLIPKIIYKRNNSVAIIKILKHDLTKFAVDVDQIADLVDLFMQIQTLTTAVVIREDLANHHKLSFRSRAGNEALEWARFFNGGGHMLSSGAYVDKSMAEIEASLEQLITASNLVSNETA